MPHFLAILDDGSEFHVEAPGFDEAVQATEASGKRIAQIEIRRMNHPREIEYGGSQATRITAEHAAASRERHRYEVLARDAEVPLLRIAFQDGPIGEVGVNGIQTEDLLAIVIDRLGCFQRGELPCRENEGAIKHAQVALEFLLMRMRERRERGVEGTMNP